MLKTARAGLVIIFLACGPADRPVPEPEVVGDTSSHLVIGRAFTLKESQDVHRQFGYPFSEWTGGEDFSRYVYLRTSEFWPQIIIERAGAVRSLSVDPSEWIGDFPVPLAEGEMGLAKYVEQAALDGVIVVHRGSILFESYPRMLASDKHIWFSVSKTVVSLALAILEDRGLVDVHRPIDSYLEALADTAWAGTPILDLLDMASGIDCPEVRTEVDSCFWSFYEAFGWPETEHILADPMDAVARMSRAKPSGKAFEYTSVNTEVLNLLIETVSGERFADFVEREIWQRTGAESDALVTSTANGHSFSAGGFSSTLRDLARYGLLFTSTGRVEASPVVSDAHLHNIQQVGRPELMPEGDKRWWEGVLGEGSVRHNSRQWDVVTHDGDFYKEGFGGQGLYVSPTSDLVVAWFGTQTAGRGNRMLRIARQIRLHLTSQSPAAG